MITELPIRILLVLSSLSLASLIIGYCICSLLSKRAARRAIQAAQAQLQQEAQVLRSKLRVANGAIEKDRLYQRVNPAGLQVTPALKQNRDVQEARLSSVVRESEKLQVELDTLRSKHEKTCLDFARYRAQNGPTPVQTDTVPAGAVQPGVVRPSAVRPGAVRPGAVKLGAVQSGSAHSTPVQRASAQAVNENTATVARKIVHSVQSKDTHNSGNKTSSKQSVELPVSELNHEDPLSFPLSSESDIPVISESELSQYSDDLDFEPSAENEHDVSSRG